MKEEGCTCILQSSVPKVVRPDETSRRWLEWQLVSRPPTADLCSNAQLFSPQLHCRAVYFRSVEDILVRFVGGVLISQYIGEDVGVEKCRWRRGNQRRCFVDICVVRRNGERLDDSGNQNRECIRFIFWLIVGSPRYW